MKRPPLLAFSLRSAWAAVVIVVACAAGATSLPQGSAAATAPLTATIRAVNEDVQEIEVVSGVGHALRAHSMKVDATCTITVEGHKAMISDLEPGQMVRVRYRNTDEGMVALAIDTPPPPPGGGR